MLPTLLLLLISAWYAWRYSRIEADPDWALFNLPAFTGSWYGRDYPDCKSPAIYAWFYALAKLTRGDMLRIRFLHQFLIGAGSVLVYWMTGSPWAGLAFLTLVSSGWLYNFHGNVSQLPAVFAAVALGVDNPWLAALAMGIAIFNEPKLVVSGIAMTFIYHWWIPVGVYLTLCTVMAVIVWKRKPEWVGWLLESAWVIPKRMGDVRRKVGQYGWAPWFTSQSFLYIMPWLYIAVRSNASWTYWLPPALFLVMLGASKAVRQNHLIPLAAWVAMSQPEAWWVMALFLWDMVSGGLYLGDIWHRFYIGLLQPNLDAEHAGKWLRNKPGTIWVNTYHTAVYLHARKPVLYGMTEQYEINRVATERRALMMEKFKSGPPDWVVDGEGGIKFGGQGYMPKVQIGGLKIWKRSDFITPEFGAS